MKILSRAIVLLVLLLGVMAAAANHPVPFTLTCFMPDQQFRSYCHKQVNAARIHMWARSVYDIDARILSKYQSLYIGMFERMLEQHGLEAADVGVEPDDLRRMIQEKIRKELGDTI